MSNQVEALVLLHLESGCWLLAPKYRQQLQHKNGHYEYTDVQQEMHSFFSGVSVSDSSLGTCFFVRFLGDSKSESVSD